jgi:hypothetical protein
VKYAIVGIVEMLCNYTHWFTHRRPWVLLKRLPFGICVPCPFADLSHRLDERWGTGYWKDGSPDG